MRCRKKHPFDELIDQIEDLVENWQERVEEQDEEQEEHPVIRYQYQKGVMSAFALLTNVVRELDMYGNSDAWWMLSNWIEANHKELGDCDTYLRALHASEEDAKDICETALRRYDEVCKEMSEIED